jgi:ubiquinone/menaquinone biosynthesis C-methylase UbiE
MNYQNILYRCEESKHLISMVSVDEIIRFGYSMGLNEQSKVLDLCCGYGTVLKIWNEAFSISGVGVDLCDEFISKGKERLKEAGIDNIKLIIADVLKYNDSDKYDVVICSETFLDTIQNELAYGEKFLKPQGVLAYHKVYSKVPNPPQELVDFDIEVLPLSELNREFNRLGYYITHMASDTDSEWERYITRDVRRDINKLRSNPCDEKTKAWIDKWYRMYFDYRRPYEGQALFGLEKL